MKTIQNLTTILQNSLFKTAKEYFNYASKLSVKSAKQRVNFTKVSFKLPRQTLNFSEPYVILPEPTANLDQDIALLGRDYAMKQSEIRACAINLPDVRDSAMKKSQMRDNYSCYNEWQSSEYTYSTQNGKFFPVIDKLTSGLIRSYYTLNRLKSRQRSKKVSVRFKRLCLNRILVSAGQVKHTNEKANVTFYVYNKIEKYFQFKLENISSNNIVIRKKSRIKKNRKGKKVFSTKNKLASKKYILSIRKRKTGLITSRNRSLLRKCKMHKWLIIKGLRWNKGNFISYENKYYRKYLKKLHKRQLLSLYYTKMLRINNNIFKNWFTLGINSLLSKVYKKPVELNIVNLKYLHYNSDNFTQAIGIKLKNRNNRLLKVLKKAMKLVRLPSSFLKIDSDKNQSSTLYPFIQNVKLNKISIAPTIKYDMVDSILKTIKDKTVNGVRLEAAGRLSRRLTASRSVFKYKYIGSLKNTDSSYKNLSSTLVRGHAKPNIRYTSLHSKTRNGAFGIKGWISSY